MKNFINLSDIGKKDLRSIINNAKSEKKKKIFFDSKYPFKKKN